MQTIACSPKKQVRRPSISVMFSLPELIVLLCTNYNVNVCLVFSDQSFTKDCSAGQYLCQSIFKLNYFPIPVLEFSSGLGFIVFWAITEAICCTLWKSDFLPPSLAAVSLCGHMKMGSSSDLEHNVPVEWSG